MWMEFQCIVPLTLPWCICRFKCVFVFDHKMTISLSGQYCNLLRNMSFRGRTVMTPCHCIIVCEVLITAMVSTISFLSNTVVFATCVVVLWIFGYVSDKGGGVGVLVYGIIFLAILLAIHAFNRLSSLLQMLRDIYNRWCRIVTPGV